MQKPRTIFIGDVHGCYDEMIDLIQKINLCAEDNLYFTGDLINKGPKSGAVVDFVYNRPNTRSVIGNHEYFSMIHPDDVMRSENVSENTKNWIINAIPKYAEGRCCLNDYRDWILSLPVVIESDEWILVHGGIHPDYGIDTPVEIATTIRTVDDGLPWYEHYFGKKKVIYGHWAVDGLRIRHNTVGLDSGCAFGGHLTAYCFETGEFWQVHAHDVYKIPADHKGKITKIL